jgi:hypothetical protein
VTIGVMATNRFSYAIAVVTYVVAGVAWKPLLNWIVGPLWVVVVAGVLPDLARSARRAR